LDAKYSTRQDGLSIEFSIYYRQTTSQLYSWQVWCFSLWYSFYACRGW